MRIEPFFFGDRGRELFGTFHPAAGVNPPDAGIVLCNPFGSEYMRAHRAMAQLARRLAGEGFHVLRFDYYGCGDSAGDSAEGTLAQWTADAIMAFEQLRAGADVQRIFAVGLRLGAAIAAIASADSGHLSGVVLWDPVFDGAAYLRELRDSHAEWLRGSAVKTRKTPGAPEEILGFPLPAALADELETLDLLVLADSPAANSLVIETGPKPVGQPLGDRLARLSVLVEHLHIPGDAVWVKQAGGEELRVIALPEPTLEAIVRWCTKGTQS